MTETAVSPEPSVTTPGIWRFALIVSLVLTSAAYFPFTLGAQFSGFQVDGALYVLMAEYFSPFVPADPLLDYVGQATHLPPLYSLLLGWAGSSGSDLEQVHLVQTIFLIGGLLTLYLFAAALAEDRTTALLVLWAFALLPATVLYSSEIWSEFLYLMLANGALCAAARAATEPRLWWWAAVLAGLATITRGVGILIIAALVLVVIVRRNRHALMIGAVAITPSVIVELLNLGSGAAYLEIYNYYRASGTTGLIHTVTGNANLLFAALLSAWEPAPRMAIGIAVIALAPFVLKSWWYRLRTLQVDACYLLAYVGVLLIWPFPHVIARLVYAGLPLIMIYAVVGVGSVAEHRPTIDRRLLMRIPAVVLVLLALTGSGVLAARFSTRDLPGVLSAFASSRYWLMPPAREHALADLRVKQAMLDTLQSAPAHVPPRECIHSHYPQSVMLYSRRLSWPAPDRNHPGKTPCRWHLILSDARGPAELAALTPGYAVIHSERVDTGVAGILVRYPD